MLKVSQNKLLYTSISLVGVALALRLTLPMKPHIELAVFTALYVAIALIAWYSGRKAFFLANADQTQAEDKLRQSDRRLEFLSNATSQLGTSPDYKTTIANVAKLAVPFLADICIVDLIETLAPSQNRVAVAHVEPAKEQLLTELSSKYPYILNQNSFISKVVSDRIPYLISEVTESLILEYAQDAEHLRLLKELGNYHSMMIVPLLVRGRILGVISFVTTQASCRIYTEHDLAFAEDLARAIALAIDNAQLYQKTQQAEQRNDEFLALLDACTSSAPIGLAFLDRQGHYIRINDALANIYHINAAENLGKTVWDTLPDELASAVDAKIKQVLQTQQPILNVEETGKYADIYCISNYYPVRSELGEILGVGMAVLDISERKQAEAALYQQEQEFKALVENVPDIIVRLDRDLRYLYACRTVEQATGISPAAFIGKTNNELGFPQQMCTLWNQNLQKVFATGVAHQFEFEIPTFNDGTHYYESRLIPEFSQDNSINSVLGIVRDMTEYKRAEQALRQSEERFRELAENIQDVFWMFNPIKRQFLYVSPAYQQWGYSCDVCTDYTQWFEAIHPDDRQRVRNAYLNCELEEGFNQEYRIIRQDLSISWIRDRCVAIKNESGEIYRLAGIAEDISEQKESQETIAILNRNLQRRAHELQTLFDVIPIAIGISLDSESRNIKVNPAYAQILNIPENANASITPLENASLPPYKIYRRGQEVSDNQLPLQIASSGVEVRDAEIDIMRADGAVFNLFGYASPLFDEQGKPRGAVSAFIDISDRVSHEAILRDSEERVRMATTAAELGMWFWHLPTNELTWTPKCNELLGLPANNPMGYDIFLSCLHPEDCDRTQQAIKRGLQQNVEYDTEYRVIWSDNSIHWIAAKGRAFHDASGNPVRMMGTVQDITKRKQADAERVQLLEREKAARAEAEAANRIKDEFLAVLSHELRTPLNPILGWAKLLRKRKFDQTATDKALETIERNAKLQAQLVEDLLDVSRILRGKLSLNVCPVNLATTIEAAYETVRLSAQAKSIEIKTILDPNVGRISGDSNRLQQVMWNLLSNAVKFTPPGGCVEVRLSAGRGQGDKGTRGQGGQGGQGRQGGQGEFASLSPPSPLSPSSPPSPPSAQITVSDTGKGIDPDFLPYVFDYFRQADSSTTRRFGGLGLGLAIVRHIIELHGGTIWAESLGEGQGATFTIQLPLMKSAESKIPSSESSASNSALNSDSALSGVRVLVVDDDADMREYLACVLQQSGAEVAVVTSAYEALEALQKTQPDVLLSDIGMPNMDGYMLLRQVRSLEAQNGGQVRAIALTAYAGEYDRKLARAAGFQMHIPKPVEPERLIEALSKWGIGHRA